MWPLLLLKNIKRRSEWLLKNKAKNIESNIISERKASVELKVTFITSWVFANEAELLKTRHRSPRQSIIGITKTNYICVLNPYWIWKDASGWKKSDYFIFSVKCIVLVFSIYGSFMAPMLWTTDLFILQYMRY